MVTSIIISIDYYFWKDGSDAKPYQEKLVFITLKQLEEAKKKEQEDKGEKEEEQ